MLLSACSRSVDDSKKTVEKVWTGSSSTWKVSVKNVEISDGLNTVAKVKQYDGSLMDVAYTNIPSEGNEYLLLEIEVEKIGTGTTPFAWNNAAIKNAKSDVEYKRVDDVFLTDHGYQRMNGTDLKIGDNDGWICFEIPETSETADLEFLYTVDDEKIQISLGE